jgi:acyl carrier protein
VREALAYDDVHVLPLPSRDFPRTTSGKLERATLRQRYAAGDFNALDAQTAPAQTAASTRPQPPRHAVEEQITRIWSEVLKVPADAISREDRFLAIGGTSLAAMHVLSELEEAFGGPIEPAVLRDCATVSALAEHLVGRHHAPAAPAGASESGSGQAAVIGLACRFPDADTPDAFWNNLASGRDSVTEVPATKWGSHRAPCARWGAFLDDTAGFDAGYFGVAADEATVMDPHARIFLEVAHEALERAGYAGRTSTRSSHRGLRRGRRERLPAAAARGPRPGPAGRPIGAGRQPAQPDRRTRGALP